ncbi:MAG: bifunctional tRNA (5-methylaminomethyl-2-thiouridine)(34)-methyltransferase MnmD/FAD-dependent 5-carboxymethylaminomethyl-2-thiouridine(34) oxidoreductase MnmC [Pseudomonadota bacterium]
MLKSYVLQPAELAWEDQGPVSLGFNDIYFSRLDGLAESRYVFLQQNRLPERWENRAGFTIVETGFGTGLNFLATWAAWRASSAPGARLHYVSIEKHPLAARDLERALGLWPELHALGAQLLPHYPPPFRGLHRVSFPQDRITLTLCFGDVEEVLPQLEVRADAWYLDGFDPAKNPQMWSEALFTRMARLTRAGGTFATFTSAGWVRRGLQAAGFAPRKFSGFGRKREMLCGELTEAKSRVDSVPWYALPEPRKPGRAAVIGAGLAGAACARALAEAGWEVVVLEASATPAQAASGNPAGVFYPALTAEPSLYSRFYLAAFLYALRVFARLTEAGGDCGLLGQGVLMLAQNDKTARRYRSVLAALGDAQGLARWMEAAEARELCGVEAPAGGMYFPRGGWLQPSRLVAALLQHQGIHCRYRVEANALVQDGAGAWTVRDAAGDTVPEAEAVIIATGAHAAAFEQSAWLPVIPARGQITVMAATDQSRELRCAVCHEGYVIPAVDARHVLGASFAPHDARLEPRAADDAHNLALLRQALPDLARDWAETAPLGHRVGIRAATPDQLPMVGPLPQRALFLSDYAELHHGRHPQSYPRAQHHPGLYVCAGLGARGITSALLCAELLCAQITGAPLPLERELVDALNPARFLVRQLKRRPGATAHGDMQ